MDRPTDFSAADDTLFFTREELTTLTGKAHTYAAEPTFRETLHACADIFRESGGPLGARLRGIGLGVFRPDAIAAGKVAPILDYLADLNVHPFYAAAVPLARQTVREIWRFQLNAAPGGLLKVFDLLYDASPAIVALFACPSRTVDVPTAVIMADAKGEADPAQREGWELRSRLGSPNRLLSYFHTADEPADVVRDGGIVLGPEGLAAAAAGFGRTPVRDTEVFGGAGQVLAHPLPEPRVGFAGVDRHRVPSSRW